MRPTSGQVGGCMVTCTVVEFSDVEKKKDMVQVKLKDQVNFVMERQLWFISNHIIQLVPWTDYQKYKQHAVKKFYLWFHLGKYPSMYIKVPIMVENLMESKYFEAQDLNH